MSLCNGTVSFQPLMAAILINISLSLCLSIYASICLLVPSCNRILWTEQITPPFHDGLRYLPRLCPYGASTVTHTALWPWPNSSCLCPSSILMPTAALTLTSSLTCLKQSLHQC